MIRRKKNKSTNLFHKFLSYLVMMRYSSIFFSNLIWIYSLVSWNKSIHYMTCSLLAVHFCLAWIGWSTWIWKSQTILCVFFSTSGSCLHIWHWALWSKCCLRRYHYDHCDYYYYYYAQRMMFACKKIIFKSPVADLLWY